MRLAAAALTLAVASCAAPAARGPVAPTTGPHRCEPAMAAPAGFEEVAVLEDPGPDHVGMRVSFADGRGRELHAFSGIAGEFGEGLPVVDRPLVEGVEGRLQGDERVWVLSWSAGGPCGDRAVLGNGLGREDFLDAVRQAGLIRPV